MEKVRSGKRIKCSDQGGSSLREDKEGQSEKRWPLSKGLEGEEGSNLLRLGAQRRPAIDRHLAEKGEAVWLQ